MRLIHGTRRAYLIPAALLSIGCGGSGMSDPTTAPPRGETALPARPPTGLVFVENWWFSGRIALADTNGANVRRLAAPVNVNGVDWSPDGSELVFDGGDGDSLRLYVMRADGTGYRRLTRYAGPERHPAWSPDGSRIVYERSLLGGFLDLYVTRVSDGETTRLTALPTGVNALTPTWSADGRKIAFSMVGLALTGRLAVMDADGKNLRTLTGPDGWHMNGPAWSPDGRYIAASGTDATNDMRSRLFLFDLNAGAVRQFLDSPSGVSHELSPAWSADGAWITFSSIRGQGSGGSRIYKVRPDGSGLTPLTPGGWDGWPRWRR